MKPVAALPLLSLALGIAALSGAQAADRPRPSSSARRSLHEFLAASLHADWAEMQHPRFAPEFRYAAAFVDLNGDGRHEAIVHHIHGRCGTGNCGIEIFTPRRHGWHRIAYTSIGHPPIRVLNTRHRGWRDLGILVAGGGVYPAYEARLAFDGRTYPYNPSMPPARPLRAGTPGRVLIAQDDRGRLLFQMQARRNVR